MNFIILVEHGCTCLFDLWKFYILAFLCLKFFSMSKCLHENYHTLHIRH